MNVERRRRQLLALINDPATFEGERENARRALERLGAPAPPPPVFAERAQGSVSTWDLWADDVVGAFGGSGPRRADFEEMLRAFSEAAESPAERARRARWEAASAERQRRWHEAAGAGFRESEPELGPEDVVEEVLRSFREATETPSQRARRRKWEAETEDRLRRWRAEAAAEELARRFREGRS